MAENVDIDNLSKNVKYSGYKDIDDLSQVVLKSVMGAVRSSNELPISGDDFDFCSSFSSFQQYLGAQGTRLLQLIQTSIRYHGARGSMSANSELTDVEDRFDVLVDANDQLLERVGTLLDEVSGLRKKETSLVVVTKTPKQATASGGWNKKSTPTSSSSTLGRYRLLTARNIRRPQAQFKDKIDNSERPFVPKILAKPNALKPLLESLQCDIPDEPDPSFCFPHPYQYEVDNYTPDSSWLEKTQPQHALPIESTPLTIISTEDELNSLCQVLKTQTEFAVDLEAHSYRTYQGFTCLIQISTRNHDYVIDALALREHLHALNDSFTDPKIMKVFHGADHDVVWLQRDFGVYLVGLFDTHQASRSMAFHRHRLQDLLWHYCSVETNKEYQLEDWRIRPLPDDFLLYARMDTHYLLYIYDCIKNDLLHRSNEQKNILMSVFQRSTQICAKRYVKPRLRSDSYKDLLVPHRKVFNPQQLAALKGIYEWRDKTARRVDESSGFVLPNLMMLQMAELLPREPEGILACCSSIPPLVQECLMDLHHIIKEARDTRSIKKDQPDNQQPSMLMPPLTNTRLMYSPHDLSHPTVVSPYADDESNDLVAVLSQLFTNDETSVIEIKQAPILSALLPGQPTVKKSKVQRRARAINRSFVNPFLKYLALPEDAPSVVNLSDGDSTVWKLMPNTVKQSAVLNHNRVVEVVKTAPTILFDAITQEDKSSTNQETGDVTTVRQQMSCERQQKSSSAVAPSSGFGDDEITSSTSSSSVKKHKRKRDKSEPGSASVDEFVAYDYSKADFNRLMNDEGDKSSKKGQKKKKREFNPNASLVESDFKGVPKKRPLLHTTSVKNLTYGQNVAVAQSAPKIPWPKR